MKIRRFLVSLLVLSWVGTPHGVLVSSEPLYPTQENFDLGKALGKWFNVAVASTCPHMQRYRGELAIDTLELQSNDTDSKLKIKSTVPKYGTCELLAGDLELTNTSGRFYYQCKGCDVDAYVVHTNYNEYAIVMMKRQSSYGSTTLATLYSRTMDVRATVLDDFKRLVKEQGISDNIIIKQNKGECVPGEPVSEPEIRPEPQRVRRNVVPTNLPAEEEGSADDTPLFRGPEACQAEADVGPCFGIIPRYYYNSSSMTCQLFNYGGCAGNQNNFETERECLQSCRTEAACRLPMEAYPCTGKQPQVWAFDSNSGLCLAYKQDFCQANGNRFYSKAECQEYCGVVKDVADEELLKAN